MSGALFLSHYSADHGFSYFLVLMPNFLLQLHPRRTHTHRPGPHSVIPFCSIHEIVIRKAAVNRVKVLAK